MIGMFALAPVSGLVADRWGGRVALATGFGTLLVATLMAALNATGVGSLAVALLLLGFGWNQVFVGGSSLLSPQLASAERGAVDGVIWLGSAFAGLGAGPLLASGGYDLVGLVALLLLLFRSGDLVRGVRDRHQPLTRR